MKPTNEPLTIESLGKDRDALIREVERLESRVQTACGAYVNRTSVVHLSDQMRGENGVVLSWALGLDLKDMILLAAICQAPLAFRGGTDRGKTALAELELNALFGTHGEEWWRVEICRAMALDDLIDVDLKRLLSPAKEMS